MKEILLKPFFLAFTIFGFFFSEAQYFKENQPVGVSIVSGLNIRKTVRFASFFFKDKNQRYWIGYGATPPKYNNTLSTNGLISFKDTNLKEHSNAIFTGYVERGDSIIFASNIGLQYYKNEIFRIDSTYKKIKDIIVHKGLLIAATEGNGIIIERKSGLESVILKNQGILYDSIYSLFSDGDVLWLGTQKGLISISGEINNQTLVNKIESSNFPNLGNLSISQILKDKYGRLWFIADESVLVRYLYIYENNEVISINEKYAFDCNKIYLPLEKHIFTLDLNKNGNITFQNKEFIFEFFSTEIKIYTIDFEFSNIFGLNMPTNVALYSDDLTTTYSLFNNLIYKINFDKHMNDVTMNYYTHNNNTIDINKVYSKVGNCGFQFSSFFKRKFLYNNDVFVINEIACASPFYSSTLWLGGIDSQSNTLHIAAEEHRNKGGDYQNGPIEFSKDTSKMSKFNKVWKVNKKTIDYFIKHRNDSNYSIPSEILEWPGSLEEFPGKPMAPFEDINNNEVYEPYLGEYPKIKGDQMLWWIFNDALYHSETDGNPLNVEVHGSCYAYYHSELSSNHPDDVINKTLFFNYKIFNYSGLDYSGFKVGIFNNIELGSSYNDQIGCDTINSASFTYNDNNYDQTNFGIHGYGHNPPILFCKFLNKKMTNHMVYKNNRSNISGSPSYPKDYYNYLNSYWMDNSKLTIGGDGNQGTIETNYMFPGSICNDSGWNAMSGNINKEFQFSLMSTGLEKFQKDSVFELDFAYIMLHDPETDFLIEECDKPSNVLQKIQNWYDTDSFPSLPSNKLDFALNSEWHYDVSANNPFMSLQRYSHTKDTSIQGKHVRVIEEDIKNQNSKNKFSKLYIYENGDTVFLYNFNKNKFLRFLIFNAPIGSVLELDVVEELEGFSVQNFTLRVNDIQIKYIDGIPLKYYQASIVSPFILSNINLVFMDKIGWFNSFYPILLPQTTNTFGGLRCFRNNEIDTNYTNVPCDFMYMLSLSSLEKKLPLHVYPNPSADILNLDFDSRINDFTVNIMNINGVQMHSSNNQRSINVKDYSPGLYYLILKTETQLVVKKWIKL